MNKEGKTTKTTPTKHLGNKKENKNKWKHQTTKDKGKPRFQTKVRER